MRIQSFSKRHEFTPSSAFMMSVEDLPRRWQHRHELWILSCYVDFSAVQQLVRDVAERVKLSAVYLAFDYSEVYRHGMRKLGSKKGALQQSCTKRGIDFECCFLAVPTGLVHGKGYAVIQRVNEKVSGGSLLIGSPNLTSPGFKEGRNVELGALTNGIGHLRSFEQAYNELWEKYGEEEIGDTALRKDIDLFKFALLSSGVFLHKWDGTLRQATGVRYKIINDDEWIQIPDYLQDEGFEYSKTLTRHLLDLSSLPARKLPATFIKNFTIETCFGRWCPEGVWNEVANPEFDAFHDAFRAATSDEILTQHIAAASVRQEELISRELIAPVEPDHLKNWSRRIKTLSGTPERLARWYTGYEALAMPLDAKRKGEIDDLYQSLFATMEARSKENWATRAVRACISSKSLDPLSMDDEARELLQ